MQTSAQGYYVGVCFTLLPMHICSRCQCRHFQSTYKILPCSVTALSTASFWHLWIIVWTPPSTVHKCSTIVCWFWVSRTLLLFGPFFSKSICSVATKNLREENCQGFILSPPWYYFYCSCMSNMLEGSSSFWLSLLDLLHLLLQKKTQLIFVCHLLCCLSKVKVGSTMAVLHTSCIFLRILFILPLS